jgi:hypothetical protein
MVVFVWNRHRPAWEIGTPTTTLGSLRAGVGRRNGNRENGDGFGALLFRSDNLDEFGRVDIAEFLFVINVACLTVLPGARELDTDVPKSSPGQCHNDMQKELETALTWHQSSSADPSKQNHHVQSA